MSTIYFREKVRVVTGEISRAAEPAVLKDMKAFYDNKPATLEGTELTERFNRYTAYMLALRATRAIATRDNPEDEWQVIEPGQVGVVEISEGEIYALQIPMTEAEFDALPTSLTRSWIATAIADNERLGGTQFLEYFFPSTRKDESAASETPPNEANSSASASGSAPLSEPSRPTSPPMMTSGTSAEKTARTSTRKTSSDGS